jgi:hypothetical protein
VSKRRNRALLLLCLATAAYGIVAPRVHAAPPLGGAAPVEGEWGGRTSAALPVSFTVREGQIEAVRFAFTWGFCGVAESALPNTEPIRPDGSWVYLDGRGPKVEATFTAPDQVTGTVVAPSRELPSCEGSEATFLAVPGPVPPPPPVLIPTGRGHLSPLPDRITLPGPALRSLHDLRWSQIGVTVAHATGRTTIHRRGKTIDPRVSIVLEDPYTRDAIRTFALLRFTLQGPLPKNFERRATIHLRPEAAPSPG